MSENKIEAAMLKVAPGMAVVVEHSNAVEYALKGMVAMPDPDDYQLLEVGKQTTLSIVLSPKADHIGHYIEHDPIEMTGQYVGVIQYVRAVDGWPVFGGMMVEESALLHTIEIDDKLFCAYAAPKEKDNDS